MATASEPHARLRPPGRPPRSRGGRRADRGALRDHGRLVGGLCRALLRDRAEAEDAAQQIFLAAHRALLNGTSPREPAAWLATIARNECWARIRTRMREPLPSGRVDDAAAPTATRSRRRSATPTSQRSGARSRELPRQQRDALLLREFGGLSYEELAGALAVSGPGGRVPALPRAHSGCARAPDRVRGLTGASWLDSLGRLARGRRRDGAGRGEGRGRRRRRRRGHRRSVVAPAARAPRANHAPTPRVSDGHRTPAAGRAGGRSGGRAGRSSRRCAPRATSRRPAAGPRLRQAACSEAGRARAPARRAHGDDSGDDCARARVGHGGDSTPGAATSRRAFRRRSGRRATSGRDGGGGGDSGRDGGDGTGDGGGDGRFRRTAAAISGDPVSVKSG